MTSRERVVCTLCRKGADRMPIDFGGTGTTGINAVVYNGVRKLLGIDGGTIKVREVLSQLPEIEPEMLEAMRGDVVVLWRQAPCLGLPVTGFKAGTLSDGTPCLMPDNFNTRDDERKNTVFCKEYGGRDLVHPYKRDVGSEAYDYGVPVSVRPAGYHAFARVYHPLKGVDTIDELRKFDYPEMDVIELDYLRHEARRLQSATDKAVCGVFCGNIFELGQLYFGYEDFFVNLISEEKLMDYYFETRMEVMMRDLEKYMDAVGDYIQIIQFTEDLGTQSSLLIPPWLYRSKIKPLHRRMFDYIKKNHPGTAILLHSCGAVSPLIPDFIEIGADALNPVQITAAGMEPEKLKREFGNDIVFWGGGVDTQKTLCLSGVNEVKSEVRRLVEILSGGGGYIFSQVHNAEASVPPENLLAAFFKAWEMTK
ncbi:MAG: hypothetical protein FWD23_06780 [Oscillospiraceae bacterium]|nr:hypothetical protein [Oscillospiraceae bacterium]